MWQALQDHAGLTALDMSWNSIGQQNVDVKDTVEAPVKSKGNVDGGSGNVGATSKGKGGGRTPAAAAKGLKEAGPSDRYVEISCQLKLVLM